MISTSPARSEYSVPVTPYITITDDADGNPWAIVHGFPIDAGIMDKLVAAWLLKAIVPPYAARRGYEDSDDWTLS